MKKSIIGEKSFEFALGALKLHEKLMENNVPVIPNQFLRSATSIGANVEEGLGARSERDFFAKFSIARKEARESHYWLKLIHYGTSIDRTQVMSLLKLSDELVRMLTSATITLEKRLSDQKTKQN